MSPRTWLLSQLARFLGGGEEDPNRLVELVTVKLYEASVIAEVLAQHGFRSRQIPQFEAVTGQTVVRFEVPQADVREANAVLVDFRRV